MAATADRFVSRLTAYAKQDDETPDEFVIPEDLTELSDDDLATLHEQAVAHFDSVYGDGTGLTEESLNALTNLTEGIETLAAEVAQREKAANERAEAAAQLAARAKPHNEMSTESPEEDQDEEDKDEEDQDGEDEDQDEDTDVEENPDSAAEAVTASGKKEIRVNMSGLRRPHQPRSEEAPKTMRDVVLASGEGTGYAPDQGLDWNDVGKVVDRRLSSFSLSQYENANKAGRHLRQQFGVATLHKPSDPELVVQNNDPGHVDSVIRRAIDESRLPGGSLVASGGWCAPSETLYDLIELESRDGLINVPEIGIARGGVSRTLGPDFADIFNGTGWNFTEDEDIAGDYGEDGVKPCYKVECPDFEEVRLQAAGLCITAGLLQQRGYPEVIARTVRGALVAHDHKMAAAMINAMVEDSTEVTMPTGVVGATAPLLTAIELQVEHYRYTTRIARSTTLEAVFPFWVRGVVRSDLSRRTGVDLLSVTDAQIDGWFRARGINPQFVYNWQDITGDPAAFTGWPETVDFLLYGAGTWVKGTSDIITLDTIYDSVLLGTNDYTALFTEEGWLALRMGHDSRVVSVPFCPSGETAAAVATECDGTAGGGDAA